MDLFINTRRIKQKIIDVDSEDAILIVKRCNNIFCNDYLFEGIIPILRIRTNESGESARIISRLSKGIVIPRTSGKSMNPLICNAASPNDQERPIFFSQSARGKGYGIFSSMNGRITMSWTQPSSTSIQFLIIFAMVSGFR